MWGTIFAELITLVPSLTNAVGYRMLMLTSMELVESNEGLSLDDQERALFIIRKCFTKMFGEDYDRSSKPYQAVNKRMVKGALYSQKKAHYALLSMTEPENQ